MVTDEAGELHQDLVDSGLVEVTAQKKVSTA
jgi:hypothetical protein